MKLNKQLPDSYMNQILNKIDKVESNVSELNSSKANQNDVSNLNDTVNELNKNISEQQIVLDNYSDRLASIESIMGSYVESDSGSFVINGLQANGGTTERIITFSNPLFKVPTVTTSTSDPAASLTVSNVSQSGFKIKIVNTYKYDAISPVISWIAVAK